MAAWSDNESEPWEGVLIAHNGTRRKNMELVQALRQFTAAMQHTPIEGLIAAGVAMLLIYAFAAWMLQG